MFISTRFRKGQNMQYMIRFLGGFLAVICAIFARDAYAENCEWTAEQQRVLVSDPRHVYCKVSAMYIRGSTRVNLPNNLTGYVVTCNESGYADITVHNNTDAGTGDSAMSYYPNWVGPTAGTFRVFCSGGKASQYVLAPIVSMVKACEVAGTGEKASIEAASAGCPTMPVSQLIANCGLTTYSISGGGIVGRGSSCVTGGNGSTGTVGDCYYTSDVMNGAIVDEVGEDALGGSNIGYTTGLYLGCPDNCGAPVRVISGSYSFTSGWVNNGSGPVYGTGYMRNGWLGDTGTGEYMTGCENNQAYCTSWTSGIANFVYSSVTPGFPAWRPNWMCCPSPSSTLAGTSSGMVIYDPSRLGSGIAGCYVDPYEIFTDGAKIYKYANCSAR